MGKAGGKGSQSLQTESPERHAGGPGGDPVPAVTGDHDALDGDPQAPHRRSSFSTPAMCQFAITANMARSVAHFGQRIRWVSRPAVRGSCRTLLILAFGVFEHVWPVRQQCTNGLLSSIVSLICEHVDRAATQGLPDDGAGVFTRYG